MIKDNSLAVTDVGDQVLLHALVEHSFQQQRTSRSAFLFLWVFFGFFQVYML